MNIKKILVFVMMGLTGFLLCNPLLAQLRWDTAILKPLPRITGWADNTHYIVERWNSSTRKYDASSVSIKTGKEATYQLTEKVKSSSASISNGDIYLNTPEGAKRQLTNTEAVEKLPILSPDKKWVAFLRSNDLYAIEVASGKEVRFTHDGSKTIMNGYASWVYYEEILGRSSNYRAFWWSPDSKHIAFYRFDDSGVPVYPLYNSSGQHRFTDITRYPKAGDPNPKVKVGVAFVTSEKAIWADFNPQDDQYFGKPIWRKDGSGVLIQWMPREQNNLKLFDVNPATGSKKEIYNEEQPTWISWIDRFEWLENGFLMVRDFDGWEQIYYHYLNGKLKQKLTAGKNWRTQIERVDEKTQTVYYQANAEISTRTDFYSVQLNGKQQKRLTFGDFNHSNPLLSPDGKRLITTYSNSQTPSRISLINISNGKAEEIADSKGIAFDSAIIEKREIVWLKTDDGFDLPGRITWPSKMDENKKYPVIINIYGGPNYQAVIDAWVTPSFRENEKPVIKVGFAHRGSGDLGKGGLNYLHRNLGKWEMNDYIAWVKWLRTNPHVDADRIMITGGSYGGYLTTLALTYGAEYFRYGISNYPVTDWTLYDSHYTERYMDHPEENPEGYKFGSVLTHADNYQNYGPSMLLLQHGTMDDNVHIQNTYQLTDKLQRLNKPFELMIYPGERHGFLGPKVPFTVTTRNRFLEKYLFDEKD